MLIAESQLLERWIILSRKIEITSVNPMKNKLKNKKGKFDTKIYFYKIYLAKLRIQFSLFKILISNIVLSEIFVLYFTFDFTFF